MLIMSNNQDSIDGAEQLRVKPAYGKTISW